MKIIYMGTPEFAVPPLRILCEKGYQVELVVTQPDKARDRGKKVQFPPVKEEALKYQLPVIQPEKVKDNPEFISEIKALEPDLIVVAAYGKILPKELLEIPKYGCVNIHASLLPKYRGAAPIQRSIIDGEEKTGITLMYMEEGLDTGDMIASKSTAIDRKTAAQLHEELADLGAELLAETLPEFESRKIVRVRQDDGKASYAPMIFKKDGHIDFTKSPKEIERLIRGLCPWPGAYALYKGEQMKFWQAEVLDEKNGSLPGTVTKVSEKGIEIAAGGKTLQITQIQIPGKKAMSVADFLKGNKFEPGIILE